MSTLFISHSSKDDAFVRELQQALTDLKQDVWIDSRELRGGDPLWTAIKKGIDKASAYAIVVSTNSKESNWVGKELRYALQVQQKRGRDKFPVVALAVDGAKLGVLEDFFDEEPIFISVISAAGGAEAAVDPILVALRKRKAHDADPTPQPKAEPLEELVLELTDFKFEERDGVRRASAHARLIYEPATPGQSPVRSTQSWSFVAPIGPIEAEELRWYLEKFAVWPSGYFRDRARKVEESLIEWGQLLHAAAMPEVPTANVMKAWNRISGQVRRRFSVHVDTAPKSGASAAEVEAAREAATVLLGLPWELLHDGKGFLFQGAKPTRVRRRLPNTRDDLQVPVVATPIRILLVTARPEDEACGYIDHRVSALPLVEAMEELGGLVRLHVLSPPTLASLSEELGRAHDAGKPYHVVHFDGHGVFDRQAGLGGLCFEDPQDTGKLERRQHVTIYTSELGPLLRDYRIPLVFLVVLAMMMRWEKADVGALASELIETGLATPNRYDHLTLNPALCPYLRGRMDAAEREALTARWVEAMRGYAEYLCQQQSQNIEIAATLTVLELPNLFVLLDLVQRAGDAETTINLATSLYSLLQRLGKPRLLERVGQVRDAAAAALGDAWSHARFEAARTRIEQQLGGARLREAVEGAQQLLHRARAARGQAYPSADYDLAGACFFLARTLKTAGSSEQALPLLDEARQRFEAVAKELADKGAELMAAKCLSEQGECLLALGRLDEAEAAYEENNQRAEQLDDARQVAVGKGQLGAVRMQQRRYPEALAAYAEARERFTKLDEPGTVAVSWHQTGMVYQAADQPEASEDAYRKSLAINVRLGNVTGQAGTLNQLGRLSSDLGRTEEGAAFYQQTVDKYVQIRDVAKEGIARNNLGGTLRKLRRFDEARQEIHQAIKCKEQFGHASSPWTSWSILAEIETDAGNSAAAAEAKRKAIACYLAYRRDGGENHNDDGRICLAVTEPLLAGDSAAAASLLEQLAANPNAAWLLPFIRAVQAIVASRRDRTLADAPDLSYSMAAEILFLLEKLEKAGK